MFLHIGGSQIVFNNELIGIFRIDLTDNPVNRDFLKASGKVFTASDSKNRFPKSFIVTDRDVQFSPISPLTLSRRQKGSQ